MIQLCQQATRVKDNQTVWRTDSLAATHVALAKKYNLSCGVTNFALFIDYESKKVPICWAEILPSESKGTKFGGDFTSTVKRQKVSSIVAINPNMPGNQEILFTYGYPVERETASLKVEGEIINLNWAIDDPADAFRPSVQRHLDIVNAISNGKTVEIQGCSLRGNFTTDKFNMAELSQNLTSLIFNCEQDNPKLRPKKWPFNIDTRPNNTIFNDANDLKNYGVCNFSNDPKYAKALTTKATEPRGFLFGQYAKCANGIGDCLIVHTRNLKTAFVNFETSKRKLIQAQLKRLNYYNGAVDGLYGPIVMKAIINFALSKDLDVRNPEEIFASLQVAAPVLRYGIFSVPAKTTELAYFLVAERLNEKVSRMISQNLIETGHFENVSNDNLDIRIDNFGLYKSRRQLNSKDINIVISHSHYFTDLGELNLTFRMFDIFENEKLDEFEIRGSSAHLDKMIEKVSVRLQESMQEVQKFTVMRANLEVFYFNEVVSAFKSTPLEHATRLLQDFRSNYPNSPLLAQAYLLQAHALQSTGKIKLAARSYLESYKKNETGNTAPTALLGIASTMIDLNNKDAACRTFAATFTQFPKSAEATLAKNQFVKLGCS